ncbi:NAD-dependent deacylase [Cytobacillus sp. S13-E01]|uniref:NAD-dependent deacylase n=1 Tax=Cytobacillus sp. S13-E01 TaxID=3031326 RepID=UPI0023D7DE1D|nr:NAD-dependent deacylase [Cytobacillus sp. S13-E01]MDF0728929.1 NAD-dependent deacylase [Cytobacillus sp. S13-E01]
MIGDMIKSSKHIVIFTGAGMSTESGVPDFRSDTGIWKGRNPEELASVAAMDTNRREFVEFYRKRMEILGNIKPHIGYQILSNWGERYNLKSIITQNTDGLHEQAGNQPVIPLHGTIQKLHCHNCQKTYSNERYYQGEYVCSCGGFIRPSVVLFGESLDNKMLKMAQQESQKADLFIVLGSSLVVSPANMFPILAKEHGAKLLIVNHDSAPLDSIADIVVNDTKIGDFLKVVSDIL